MEVATSKKITIIIKKWRSSLKHCTTSRRVAGSILDIIEIFWNFLNNPSDHSMTLGGTRPLTEMSKRNISWE
jgi:hypothetical protein